MRMAWAVSRAAAVTPSTTDPATKAPSFQWLVGALMGLPPLGSG
jgi:hypothetical protein